MPRFSTTRTVPHSAEEMFDLVANVRDYPDFLPMCEALNVRSEREKNGKTLLVADMTVGYRAIRESFTTKVLMKPADLEIDVAYVEGPFRYLTNTWKFEPKGENACDVHFFIDYELKSRLLGALASSVFERAFRMFSEAFEKRAAKVYGDSDLSEPPRFARA